MFYTSAKTAAGEHSAWGLQNSEKNETTENLSVETGPLTGDRPYMNYVPEVFPPSLAQASLVNQTIFLRTINGPWPRVWSGQQCTTISQPTASVMRIKAATSPDSQKP